MITNLAQYLVQEVDKLSHISEEVRILVKTFYDPKVALNSRLNTKREDILELLEDVGNISDDVRLLVENEEDLEILRKWLKLAAKVGSINEFIDKAN